MDDWYWLNDRDDPEVIAYLEAENAYADAILSPAVPLREKLFEEMKSRIRETDAGPPVRSGDWWYFSRTTAGRQYPIHCRRHDPDRSLEATTVAAEARSASSDALGEMVVLDENLLAGAGAYLALGVFDTSPDGSILAYAVDLDGSELYQLRFRNLATGSDLPEVVEGVHYGSAWAADNRTFFYVRPDEAMRPWQVWRHLVGSDPAGDELVLQESDERFFVHVELSRSERRVLVHSSSKTTSEVSWLDAAAPTSPPKVVLAREPGVEYDVERRRLRLAGPDQPGRPLLRRPGYQFRALPALRGRVRPGPAADGRPRQAGREDRGGRSVFDLHGADRALGGGRHRAAEGDRQDGSDRYIDQPEPVYALIAEGNPEWGTTSYRYGYTSLVTPRSSIEYDLASGEAQRRRGHNRSPVGTTRAGT